MISLSTVSVANRSVLIVDVKFWVAVLLHLRSKYPYDTETDRTLFDEVDVSEE